MMWLSPSVSWTEMDMATPARDRDDKTIPGLGSDGTGPTSRRAQAQSTPKINLILADSARVSVTRRTQGRAGVTKHRVAPAHGTPARHPRSPRLGDDRESSPLQPTGFKKLGPPAAAPESGTLARAASGFVVKSVALNRLHSSRLRSRRPYDQMAIEALATSLDRCDWQQPILVRPHPAIAEDYEIVVGELPFRAAQCAGLDCLPVAVCRLSDRRALECVLLEDVRRCDLAPLEVALCYGHLIKSFDYRLADLARVTGRNERQVAQVLLLLDSPKAPQPKSDMARAAPAAREQSETAAGASEAAAPGSENPSLRTEMAALERHLSCALGLKVEVSAEGRRGAVRVSFADIEQLEWIARQLSSSRARAKAGAKRPGPAG